MSTKRGGWLVSATGVGGALPGSVFCLTTGCTWTSV